MGKLLLAAALMSGAAGAATPPSPASGAAMYRAYCAGCHGADGRGGGPAAAARKTLPADLTTLARRNGGRFPSVRVFQTIEGGAAIPAHGSREMPVWGNVFRRMGGADDARVKLRIRNLVRYLAAMQIR